MNRTDSGFAGSYVPKTASKGPLSIQGTDTTPTRQRKPRQIVAEPASSPQSAKMDPSQRPASEQRSRPLRQKSTTSSSENSTNRSKSRGHGSKPSSRRTSCTIVDPSRPARHYRMKSSQPPPTATGQDIDDVLALHFRSCSIFTNPSYHSNSVLPSPTPSQGEAFGFPNVGTRFSSDSLRVVQEMPLPRESEDTVDELEKTNTTMQWNSPCTRRREYERIDKANSGLRGFFRRVTPRCVSSPQEKFYEKDQSDAGSVRRYRLDDLDEQQPMNEKAGAPRPQTSPVPRPHSRPSIKKRWSCF
ncbi:hypothetical protein PtrSN002B_008750 [Pyrenophora tritici-repentis]|uniref:Uncharacterized protein n=2 Tax=Pyrenophora tritici-repentis TaxID=45151 RepID=A0A2W1DNI1_9PLEO|nr:uncharacterized protein PTRG_02069 [Pyrenophora tritici-repentis Pt-1C-BFP]KAA8626777.1 hypothetical protein PtrV1_02457 [Pyrenophora tritici-repentis]EDU41507.1 conserved hypothetical protein [Pyrenophora tritici-repentis Pt-1C-BFP]KAF7455211.1 hypothetical protein A1F99_024690 [Pyrenophora tritici-repentis]KAF7578376.1 hypothetical protein PtrM4_026160 [Pyrenophora tritici-repentis]KAG9388967.1 hypothetical protein A1F94_001860 [Pyrenophora tritici-repentis]